jgi:hypothetical protein
MDTACVDVGGAGWASHLILSLPAERSDNVGCSAMLGSSVVVDREGSWRARALTTGRPGAYSA